jgi:hypothetical protein
MSHEPNYDATELNSMVEAIQIIDRLERIALDAELHPVFCKLFHAKEYIQKRQAEVLASVLAPEVQ